MTDEALMEELKGGSEQALQLLHQRYAPLIFALATRSLGTEGADDVVQDVLLAAWNARASYQPDRGPLRPWLLEIAHTRILNELRRRRRHPSEPLLADLLSGDEDAPEVAAWQAQRRTALNAALAELPSAERQALRLAFFEELSHSEVAAFLRMPLGTVKTRIRSGVGRLFRRLSPVLGPTLVALVAAAAMLWSVRADRARNVRAVRMLSLSDSETIRMTATEGVAAETHGSFRWHRGISTAVVTLSRPPALEGGARHWAWARFGEGWVPLCELAPISPERAMCIAEVPEIGGAPRALMVSPERRLGHEPGGPAVVSWEAQ